MKPDPLHACVLIWYLVIFAFFTRYVHRWHLNLAISKALDSSQLVHVNILFVMLAPFPLCDEIWPTLCLDRGAILDNVSQTLPACVRSRKIPVVVLKDCLKAIFREFSKLNAELKKGFSNGYDLLNEIQQKSISSISWRNYIKFNMSWLGPRCTNVFFFWNLENHENRLETQ